MSEFTEVIVSDTETTGFNPEEGAALLEVAAVPALSGTNSGWWSYVEFEGEIPAEAKAVHHILEKDVAPGAFNVLKREDAVGMLKRYEPEGVVWAFHNAAFDLQFLPELKQPVICTYRCGMHLYPDAQSHKNQVLRYYLGVEPDPRLIAGLDAHRAQYDSAVTAAIVRRMLETNSIEHLIHLTSKPVLLQKVRFGKHKGDLWSEVPRDYAQWCLYRSDMAANDADLKYTLEVRLGLKDAE